MDGNKGESLALPHSHLQTVPPAVLVARNLVSLNLSNNQLTALPTELCLLKTLRILHLSFNQLKSLPSNFNQLYILETLSLGANSLTSESIENARLDKLGQLTKLNLASNDLTFIPESLCDVDTLVHLALGENMISAIPDSIARLEKLEYLGLNGNKLTTINRAVGNIRTLKGLSIADNPLVDQNAELLELSSIVSVIHTMTGQPANGVGGETSSIMGPETVIQPVFSPAISEPLARASIAITMLPEPTFTGEDRFSFAGNDSPSSLSSISESDRATLSDRDYPTSPTEASSPDVIPLVLPTIVDIPSEIHKFSPLRTDISTFVTDGPESAKSSSSSAVSPFSLDYYGQDASRGSSHRDEAGLMTSRRASHNPPPRGTLDE
ncbi:hypothetical protein HKX48_002339 [Thoreauomyces humboldtii]|nr:hypothetical protein HKX48_002339 [Thoreauomyces humboldtii]